MDDIKDKDSSANENCENTSSEDNGITLVTDTKNINNKE